MNTRDRAYPNNDLVMRPSEKFEAKAAGQKGSEALLLNVENIFGRQRRHRALQPAAIERVIRIGSKPMLPRITAEKTGVKVSCVVLIKTSEYLIN